MCGIKEHNETCLPDWASVFDDFYNHDEGLGSSAWLVAPSTVRTFILGILDRQKADNIVQGRLEGLQKALEAIPPDRKAEPDCREECQCGYCLYTVKPYNEALRDVRDAIESRMKV